MSTFNYTQFRDEVRTFVLREIAPHAELIDREGIFPRQNLHKLARAGYNSVLIPSQYGGLGRDHVAFAIVAEEIGRVCASSALIYVMHVGAAQTIVLFGTEEQKSRWLPPIRDGKIGTYSTSEKASGGHWWFNFSEAKRDGQDYLLNASKSFTTSAGQADFYITQTRSPQAQSATDIIFFIVDGQSPGITAHPWEALGVHGNHSGPITYDNVKVAARDRLGQEGQGKDIIYHGVSPVYLIGLGAAWHGVARGALETAVEHVTRTIHRDFNRRLSDYQVLRQQLDEAKVAVASIGPWQRELASQLDDAQREGRPQGEYILPLTQFKVHAAEVANLSTHRALDVSGGYGYKRGPLERYFRDARAAIAMGPSNNIAREWIGKDLVGLPLELFEAGGE